MRNLIERNLSHFAILMVAVVCVWNAFSVKYWNVSGVMTLDIGCYYAYLPKAFNGKTDSLTEDEKRFSLLVPVNKYVHAPNGRKSFKTTMGMAILYAPFYFIAYLIHLFKYGNPGWGYEVEYREAMEFFGIACLLAALVVLRKLLKTYFSEAIVALTLVTIALGTNAFYYANYEGGMSHDAGLFLVLVFWLLTKKWYNNPGLLWSVLLGFTLGLIVLVRPSNILVIILFALHNFSFLNELKSRVSFLYDKWIMLLLMSFAAVLVWVPQMIYWHNVTGQYIFYSYPGEGFIFLRPNILNGLLSWKEGWLIYTPVGWLMIAGFFVMRRYVRKLFLSSLVFYVAFLYLIFSWWSWWYGGSFSCRAMIDSYGILAFPLASTFKYVLGEKRTKALKVCFSLVVLLLIALNLFQTYQYTEGLIRYDQMSYERYKAIFLKLE